MNTGKGAAPQRIKQMSRYWIRSYQTVVVLSEVEADSHKSALDAFTRGDIRSEDVEEYLKGTEVFEVQSEATGESIDADDILNWKLDRPARNA
jgi:hypothetical protein